MIKLKMANETLYSINLNHSSVLEFAQLGLKY